MCGWDENGEKEEGKMRVSVREKMLESAKISVKRMCCREHGIFLRG